MLYILSGEDDYSIARELDSIKKAIGDTEMLPTNTSTIDGGQVTAIELRAVCESAPFLAEKRLVIVQGLLERFAIRTPSNRSKSTKKTEHQPAGYETFVDCLNKLPESTVLILIENGVKDSNPLLKMISGKAKVKSFPLLKAPELRQWITKHIEQEGATISPPALNMLVRLIGSNLWVMSSELSKLVSYAYGRRIEEKDVKLVVSYTQQTSVFTVVDAIMEFNAREAETLLQQLLQQGATATYLLAMLYRQMRLIVRVRELKRQGLKEAEMRQRLGVASEYVVRKTLEQANRYSMPRIKQVYQQLLDTDIAVKTGKYTDELALNILLAELCQRAQATT
ncbi:MAG: DNA polymerase III subunit delta [Dehalococcoidales bacterium]|nr:DNA polymerase III subunit delta [Dehalococcoidales bacterium]